MGLNWPPEDWFTALQFTLLEFELATHILTIQEISDYLPLFLGIYFFLFIWLTHTKG